ncbi:2'-hydroxyisoflavone reductase [Madurella fahalii]|uniref:2'-hydroxyisoflavone reductase n=1 Tax=Madurella fahalii TaxID=1157608 RepID=A0ABQ0GCY0_9PEZI
MVKVALAGGSGDVGREITDALLAAGKHEILLLSRKDGPVYETRPGVKWVKTNYDDPDQLAEVLRGIQTVLSFIDMASDKGTLAQKNLIDAAVCAGVKRFAPSEWAASSIHPSMPWYAAKGEIREYLAELNRDNKILEYTLFQPGLFVNYLTYPDKSSNHITPIDTPFDFANRRALIAEGGDEARISLITAEDLANVVARAVEYEGEWPVVGGIRGTDLTLGQLIALGEKVRGGCGFQVERLNPDDLKATTVKSSWMPEVRHHSVTPEDAKMLRPMFVAGILLGIAAGAFSVSDEWNRLLPDYKFNKAEDLLANFWREKP